MLYTPLRIVLAIILGTAATIYYFFWAIRKTDGPDATLTLAWLRHQNFSLLLEPTWWWHNYDFLLTALAMGATVAMLILRDLNVVPPS